MYSSSFTVTEHVIPTCHIREYPRATIDDQEEALKLAVKQYTPKDSFEAGQAVTLIGAHANGFPKELYEPLWDELYLRLKQKGIRIRSIWIADVAQQGGSYALNEHSLGNDPSWMDHPRDLFLMVNHFRQHMQRPIVGIGHSMGGNNLINLSLMHPRLFTSLVLIDPVVQRFPSPIANFSPAKASTNRRDKWPSRADAQAAFKRSKFYQTWDPRVLDCWIKHGLRDLPTALYPDASTKEVTLTTSKSQEVFTFLRPNFGPQDQLDPVMHPDVDHASPVVTPFYRPEPTATSFKLPFLRPSALYVFGDESYLSTPMLRADKMAHTGIGVGGSGGAKAGRVREVLLEKVGHLIPMEKVNETADAITDWVVPELARWAALEKKERDEWAKIPRAQRNVLSEEYKAVMNSDWSSLKDDKTQSKL